MSLRFYMDQHIHAAITAGLRARKIDCLTAEEDGSKQLSDDDLLRRATGLGRVLLSMDDDFLRITAEWIDRGEPFAGCLYAHPMRITIGQCIANLELFDSVFDPEQMRNQFYRLPL